MSHSSHQEERNSGLPIDAVQVLVTLRQAAARAEAAPARAVIGLVGRDVPAELVRAAGFQPRRLWGDPARSIAEADMYLGRGLDEATRSILAGILSGDFGQLDGIVVSSDCDASQRLFYVLRELHRIGERPDLPAVHLVDILHLPREATAQYNFRKVEELCDVLERWGGDPFTTESIAAAIANANDDRELQRKVMELRAEVPAVISGAESLAVLAAADRMPRQQYRACLTALLSDRASLPGIQGTRLFVTGSSHDSHQVYERIEDTGCVIVGEDHDWGTMIARGRILVEEPAEDLDIERVRLLESIARHYQLLPPTSPRSSIKERAEFCALGVKETNADQVLAYVREFDEAPLWDFAAQKEAIQVPAGIVFSQQYGQIDEEGLARALRTPESTGVNS